MAGLPGGLPQRGSKLLRDYFEQAPGGKTFEDIAGLKPGKGCSPWYCKSDIRRRRELFIALADTLGWPPGVQHRIYELIQFCFAPEGKKEDKTPAFYKSSTTHEKNEIDQLLNELVKIQNRKHASVIVTASQIYRIINPKEQRCIERAI